MENYEENSEAQLQDTCKNISFWQILSTFGIQKLFTYSLAVLFSLS